MSKQRYEPEIHRVCSQDEIQKISDDLKYDCSPALLTAITDLSNNYLEVLKDVDNLTDLVPEVKYPRLPGYRPEPEDRRGNAWAWRCDIQGSSEGLLAGKTLAIKDNCAVAGVPMSNGSRLLEGYVPDYDATLVTRILDAGGRIVGKSSCDDFCFSAMGFSSVDGYSHLPSRPDLRTGGSSGGSAVLVAEGDVDMAIAADQGGSIRIPAAWTGCVGLKPTLGLVPYTGLVSIEPTVDHVGPIARNVADCALLLEAIAGPDGLDGRQPSGLEVPKYTEQLETVSVAGKTLGLLKEGFASCVEDSQSSVKQFLNSVSKAQLKTTDVSVPLHAHGLSVFMPLVGQGAQSAFQDGTCAQHVKGFSSTSLEKAVRQGRESSASLLSPNAKYLTMLGEFTKRRHGNRYATKCRNLVIKLTAQYDEALKKCDVIVMPTLTHPTVGLPEGSNKDAQATSEYLTVALDMCANTAPTDLTGHPALTLPLGKLCDGKADSVMIVGRKYDETTVLGVARALEKIIPAREGLH
ncbi:amidase [Aplysia californica]|uniref:Amidase n=1 Tax=Aplysia californica TaxID=6500 RepID=A0ABM1A7Q2_APLCA|nr:amidase [Aplysia californica]